MVGDIIPESWAACSRNPHPHDCNALIRRRTGQCIGGTMARHVFHKMHIGYLAAIVAASNAGGSGSVVGDTTTTMMWIDGVSPLSVLDAYVAAGFAGAP
jgi:hypothetical protein